MLLLLLMMITFSLSSPTADGKDYSPSVSPMNTLAMERNEQI